jgi:exodeoxyribonuclease VII small subunit
MAKRERVTAESAAATASAEQAQNFEGQLASLERIVRELERGDLPLERSLELFEQGVRLSRECQERLNEAERRIEVLLRSGDGTTTTTTALHFGADELDAEEALDEAEDESVF